MNKISESDKLYTLTELCLDPLLNNVLYKLYSKTTSLHINAASVFLKIISQDIYHYDFTNKESLPLNELKKYYTVYKKYNHTNTTSGWMIKTIIYNYDKLVTSDYLKPYIGRIIVD